VAAPAYGAGDQAIQLAPDPVAAGLIASGIALRLAQINWICATDTGSSKSGESAQIR
jgi:hypothetical protein